jgi:putative thioredoxin
MPPIDVNEANFEREVIERSATLPVVVDFWAEWCGPCRALGPILERAAESRAGDGVLAKLDTDANPELARRFSIRGIPAVKAFREGIVVDEFVGVQPPPSVERFFDRLVPSEADRLVAAGDEASLRRALELEPGRADAALQLARLLESRGDTEAALQLLEPIVGNYQAEGLAARLRLKRQPPPAIAGTLEQLEPIVGNYQAEGLAARLRLKRQPPPAIAGTLEQAFAALADGETQRGLDLLLEAFPSTDGAREDLRRVIVGELDVLGPDDPLARDARRRLAAALY